MAMSDMMIRKLLQAHFIHSALYKDHGLQVAAEDLLKKRRFILTARKGWLKPSTSYSITEIELACISYLHEEHEYGKLHAD